MNKKDEAREVAKWNALLESEGLGLIEPDEFPHQGQSNIKNIKGVWARLEASINGIKDKRLAMDVSPETARGHATRMYAGSSSPRGWHDPDGGSSVWEDFVLSFVATQKEARIADRARGAICGLDHEHRVVRLRPARKPREPGKEWRKRVLRHIMGDVSTDDDGPLFSAWFPPMPPHATADAGNGPLSIVGPILPPTEFGSDHKDAEPVRMSPVVDTMYYPPGRSPFQMSRYVASNSDITG